MPQPCTTIAGWRARYAGCADVYRSIAKRLTQHFVRFLRRNDKSNYTLLSRKWGLRCRMLYRASIAQALLNSPQRYSHWETLRVTGCIDARRASGTHGRLGASDSNNNNRNPKKTSGPFLGCEQ